MVLFVDIDFKTFKRFLLDRKTFFWCEDEDSFLIVKPTDNYFLRTIVYKEGSVEEVDVWRDMNLSSSGGVRVIDFEFEGGFLPKLKEVVLEPNYSDDETSVDDLEEDDSPDGDDVDGVVVGEGENKQVVR
jgi:hypothetical protein